MERLIRKLILVLLIMAVSSSPRLLASQQTPGVLGGNTLALPKATIAGVVVRTTTGDPIQRATVTLTPANQPAGARGAAAPALPGQFAPPAQPAAAAQQQPVSFTTTTDDQGRFQFKEVEEGPYRLVAARNGFTRQEYGQRSFNRPGTVMNVRAGQQVTDVSFRLTPASTISGRVLDSNGEPVPGVTVQALRSTYDATGKRTLQPAASTRTNDLGEYRIYWINPGRYFVSANTARSTIEFLTAGASQALFGGAPVTPNEVTDPALGLTYYPGSADPSRAVALDLQAGSEMRAVDFTLARTQRVRLTGRVIDTTTGQPPQMASVGVTSRDASSSSPLDALVGAEGNRYNPATGEFVVQNVASGSYWLQVISQGRPPQRTPEAPAPTVDALAMLNSINSARIPIEVQGSDVNDLQLNVGPGLTIRGRVRMDGGQPINATDLQRLAFSLQSTSGGASILTMLQGGNVRAAADGTFAIPRITPGDYRVSVTGLGQALYLKEARFGRDDALDGLTISESSSNELELVIRTNPGRITGTVTDATQKPVPGVQAVLVPDKSRDRQDLFRTAVTDAEGRFTFGGITPGDYRIYAWEDIEPFAYFDPAVLSQYEAAARLVRIQESSSESTEVRLIPANTP